jgi:hypothetical protein
MGLDGQRHAPADEHPTPSPKETRYPLYRWLSGSQGRSSRVRKVSPPPVLDPRTAPCVASRCAECAIPNHSIPKAPDETDLKTRNFVTYSPSRQVRYNNITWQINCHRTNAIIAPCLIVNRCYISIQQHLVFVLLHHRTPGIRPSLSVCCWRTCKAERVIHPSVRNKTSINLVVRPLE